VHRLPGTITQNYHRKQVAGSFNDGTPSVKDIFRELVGLEEENDSD
jgi:palmitoyl-protein thioesterase